MEEITLEKVSETEFKEIIQQPTLEIVRSIEELLIEKESLERGIENNRQVIIFQSAELEKVENKLLELKEMGLKTNAQVEAERAEEILKKEPQVVMEQTETTLLEVEK